MAERDLLAEQETARLVARRKKRGDQFRAQVLEWCAAAGLAENSLIEPAHFMENVARLAAHASLPEEACNYVYARSGRPGSQRAEWDNGVRQCIVVRAMLASGLFEPADLMNLVDPLAAEEAASEISDANGTLVIANHGAFEPLLWMAFRKLCPRGILMTARPESSAGAYSAFSDPAAALFAGRRALTEGSQFLISPDGGMRKTGRAFEANRKTRSLPILGLAWPVGHGAPVLAYDTNCETVWFAVRLSELGFAPVMVKGPRRQPGESFSEFEDRFWRFYAQQIENSLKGDPRNIPIGRVTLLLARAK